MVNLCISSHIGISKIYRQQTGKNILMKFLDVVG